MVVSAYCFWFQPDLPEPPYRIYEFTWVPVILCDFVANDCFCLLFQVAAWPKVKTRKKHIKYYLLVFLVISLLLVVISCHLLLFLAISYYFLPFPAMSCCFLQFPATAASCYFLLCLVIPCDVLLFPASFEHFLLCHARSCYFILFLLISCNFLRCLSQRTCDLH